jgi:MBG domain (YGX type)
LPTTGALTITPEAITITAVTNTKTYDGNTSSTNAPTVTNGTLYAVDGASLSQTYATPNAGSGLTLNANASFGGANGGNNYSITYVANTSGVISPATLTYFANSASIIFGGVVPSLSGTVTGFVPGQSLASATTGTLAFSTTATGLSSPGNYAINGSGLTANNGNYTFVQAPANATALTIKNQSNTPTSQFVSTINGNTQNNIVNINFQTPNTGTTSAPVRIAFTPNSPTSTASNPNDATTAALGINAFTRNHGLDFLPISQYDANQYSQFKLPDYDDKDGQATVFTIIARAVAHDKAADFMIDGFWNGTASDWTGANGKNLVNAKVTYSDGAGHDVAPSDVAAFPIQPGKTDFAQLLKNGPVMIGGAPAKAPGGDAPAQTPAGNTPGQTPADSTPGSTPASGTPAPAPVGWLLALNLTPDGKGIVCDDPITGKLVVLAYNQTTQTLGGITSIFDAKTKGFVALADASGDIPASVGGVAALQGFVPATFFAVTLH